MPASVGVNIRENAAMMIKGSQRHAAPLRPGNPVNDARFLSPDGSEK